MLVRLDGRIAVPFFFRVVNPSRFLRKYADLALVAVKEVSDGPGAYSGAAWAGSKLFQGYRVLRAPHLPAAECCEVASFEASSGQNESAGSMQSLWEEARPSCSFTAVRDAEVLRILYPPAERTSRAWS